MPGKKRRAQRLHSLEIERHKLPDGTPVEIESSTFSGEAGLGLRITIDLPDEPEARAAEEPPRRPPKGR